MGLQVCVLVLVRGMRWDMSQRSYSKHQGHETTGWCAGSEDEMEYKVILVGQQTCVLAVRMRRDLRSYSKHQGHGDGWLVCW